MLSPLSPCVSSFSTPSISNNVTVPDRLLQASQYLKDAPEVAYEQYHRLAEEGVPEAQYQCGVMARKGLGTEKNTTLAHAYLEKAAANGVPAAYLELGWLYVFADGGDQNTEKTLSYFEKAADQKISAAYVCIGKLYSVHFRNKGGLIVKHDKSEAFRHFEIAASLGNVEGLFYLAQFYEVGKGVAVDYDQALINYKAAAGKGSAQALFRLGRCYEKGELGVPQDIVQAFFCYKQACDIEEKLGNVSSSRNWLTSLLEVNITEDLEQST